MSKKRKYRHVFEFMFFYGYKFIAGDGGDGARRLVLERQPQGPQQARPRVPLQDTPRSNHTLSLPL